MVQQASDVRTAPAVSLMTWKPLLIGAVLAAIAAIGIFFFTLSLSVRWAEQFGVHIDFGTSGLLWVTTPVLTFDTVAVPAVLLLFNCVLIPRWLAPRLAGRKTLSLAMMALATTGLEAMLLVPLFFYVISTVVGVNEFWAIVQKYNTPAEVVLMTAIPVLFVGSLSNLVYLVFLREIEAQPDRHAISG